MSDDASNVAAAATSSQSGITSRLWSRMTTSMSVSPPKTSSSTQILSSEQQAQLAEWQRKLNEAPPFTDHDSLTESWVQLDPPMSRGSLSSSIDAIYISDPNISAYKGSTDSRNSPKSLQSPNVELDTELLRRRRGHKDQLPPIGKTGGSDWLWDWSSRPEAVPPKEYRYRFYSRSALTTPPNSPQPEVTSAVYSLRHSDVVRSQLFRVEVIFGLVVSNLVTFLLGACLGFVCIFLQKT